MRIKTSWVALSVVVLALGLLLVASREDFLFSNRSAPPGTNVSAEPTAPSLTTPTPSSTPPAPRLLRRQLPPRPQIAHQHRRLHRHAQAPTAPAAPPHCAITVPPAATATAPAPPAPTAAAPSARPRRQPPTAAAASSTTPPPDCNCALCAPVSRTAGRDSRSPAAAERVAGGSRDVGG